MVPLPPPSPTSSSVFSSDLDTESTGSFFHDRSTTLGTLIGVTFPAATQYAPAAMDLNFNNSRKQRRVMRIKKKFHQAMAVDDRRRKWWSLCRDAEARPASLGEFLEVERRYGDAAFFHDEGAAVATAGERETEGGTRGRPLFADGRVLPPAQVVVGDRSSAAARGAISRFPVSLTGICSGEW